MSVQFTIDPLQDVNPISPIHLRRQPALAGYTNFTFQRLGGDLTTDWNWENGDSNAGHDYYYQNESLSYFTGGTDGPGGAAVPIIQSDHAQNAATLLTVPINGYVAANTANDDVLYDPVTTVTGPSAPRPQSSRLPTPPPSPPRLTTSSSMARKWKSPASTSRRIDLTVVRGISGGTATPQANDPVYLSPDVRNSGANYLQTQFEQELPMKPGAPGLFHAQSHPRRPGLRGRVRQLGQYHVSLRRDQHDHPDLVSSWTMSRTSGTPRTPRSNRTP